MFTSNIHKELKNPRVKINDDSFIFLKKNRLGTLTRVLKKQIVFPRDKHNTWLANTKWSALKTSHITYKKRFIDWAD